jgi:hypothetical protein
LLVKYKKGTDKRNGNKKEKELEEENKKIERGKHS